jgi:hypothetical protein
VETSTHSIPQQGTTVPELPDAPDPSTGGDWVGVTSNAQPGVGITGTVYDRRTVTVPARGEGDDGQREVLEIATGDGKIESVPCFRSHLRELVARHDPRPGDGIALRYFGPEPGKQKERYAMVVEKSQRLIADEDEDALG